ncbi:ANTAR domain-containing response regulator [Kyrpidia spormannii]|nr:response regulator [Kyrpidia spormannii]
MSRARIMIVDDESILRMDIREILQEHCYEVVAEAGNGESAVELAHRHRPDLVLMDVKMPKINGVKAGRIIHQKLGIPIVLLTAYSDGALIEEAKNSGVLGYLVKPVGESDLIPAVEIALAQGDRLHRLSCNVHRLEKQLEIRKLVERAKGILMQEHGLSEQSAYQMLRSESMNQRVSLERMAQDVIAGRLRFDRRSANP